MDEVEEVVSAMQRPLAEPTEWVEAGGVRPTPKGGDADGMKIALNLMRQKGGKIKCRTYDAH